jgi:hypothetical protein
MISELTTLVILGEEAFQLELESEETSGQVTFPVCFHQITLLVLPGIVLT